MFNLFKKSSKEKINDFNEALNKEPHLARAVCDETVFNLVREKFGDDSAIKLLTENDFDVEYTGVCTVTVKHKSCPVVKRVFTSFGYKLNFQEIKQAIEDLYLKANVYQDVKEFVLEQKKEKGESNV